MIELPTRRGLIIGGLSLFAAPAIVKATSLMRISPQGFVVNSIVPFPCYMTATEIRLLEEQALTRLAAILERLINPPLIAPWNLP